MLEPMNDIHKWLALYLQYGLRIDAVVKKKNNSWKNKKQKNTYKYINNIFQISHLNFQFGNFQTFAHV